MVVVKGLNFVWLKCFVCKWLLLIKDLLVISFNVNCFLDIFKLKIVIGKFWFLVMLVVIFKLNVVFFIDGLLVKIIKFVCCNFFVIVLRL